MNFVKNRRVFFHSLGFPRPIIDRCNARPFQSQFVFGAVSRDNTRKSSVSKRMEWIYRTTKTEEKEIEGKKKSHVSRELLVIHESCAETRSTSRCNSVYIYISRL